MESIPRTDWEAVRSSFTAFFEDIGEVATDAQTLSFAAPSAATGLSLGRDGTSTSFMPLHDLSARWDTVAFNYEEMTVALAGAGFTYTYHLPPGLARQWP